MRAGICRLGLKTFELTLALQAAFFSMQVAREVELEVQMTLEFLHRYPYSPNQYGFRKLDGGELRQQLGPRWVIRGSHNDKLVSVEPFSEHGFKCSLISPSFHL